MNEINVDHWGAFWDCPLCKADTSDIDDKVEDQGTHFDVECVECNHKYIVRK